MPTFLQELDLFDKWGQEYEKYSASGMRISFILTLLSSFLLIMQLAHFSAPDIIRDLSLNNPSSFSHEIVNISLAIEVYMPCYYLRLDILDTLGYNKKNIKDNVTFRRIAKNGTVIGITNRSAANICYPCYGFAPEGECCNSCEALMLLAQLNGTTPTPENWKQCTDKPEEQPLDERCLIKGKITANKAEGVINIVPLISVVQNPFPFFAPVKNLDFGLTHRIDRIRFGPAIPKSSAPLHHILKVQPPNTGVTFNYILKATPLVYKVGGKVKATGFEYNALSTENIILLGQPQISFLYSYSPYTVMINQRRKSLLQFVSTTFGIISGAYAIAAFIEKLITVPEQKE